MNIKIYSKIILLTVILQIIFRVNAQQFKSVLTEPSKAGPTSKVVIAGNSFYGINVIDNKMQFGYTAKLFKNRFGIKVSRYDNSFNLVKELSLSNGERAYGPFEPELIAMNNKLVLIYFQLVGEGDNTDVEIMAAEINPTTLDLQTSKQLLVLGQKNKSLMGIMFSDFYPTLKVTVSPDNKKALLSWVTSSDNHYNYALFDEQLNVLQSSQAVIPEANKLELSSNLVLNDGSCYIGVKDHLKKGGSIGYVISGIHNKDSYTILGDNLNTHEILLYNNITNNQVMVAGTLNKYDVVYAVYIGILNRNNSKVEQIRETVFPDEFLKQLDQNNWSVIKGDNRGLRFERFLKFRYLLLDNGDIDLVSEMYGENSITDGAHAGDIIGAHFSKDNVVFFRLPKLRRGSMTTINSFMPVKWGNKIVILYNDLEENLSRNYPAKVAKSREYDVEHFVLVIAVVENGLVIERQKLLDLTDEKYVALTSWVTPLSDNKIVVNFSKLKIGAQFTDWSLTAIVTLN